MSRRRGTRDQLRAAEHRVCPYGLCSLWVWGAWTLGGVGMPGCPCDTSPGWRSSTFEGLSKPRAAVLAKGRHASRVARSIRRHERQREFATVIAVVRDARMAAEVKATVRAPELQVRR